MIAVDLTRSICHRCDLLQQQQGYIIQIEVKKYQREMTNQLYLELKPMYIQFYYQQDCGTDSAFWATISLKETSYKSTLLRAQKSRWLDLSDFMWLKFNIDKDATDSQIEIVVSPMQPRNSVKSSKNNDTDIKNPNTQFSSLLPLDQLLQIPIKKKKKFCFPILAEGEVRGQAQFKMILKQQKIKDIQRVKNKQIKGQPLQQIAHSNNSTMIIKDQSLEKVEIIKNKYNKMKPIICDTWIRITPQSFVKSHVPESQTACTQSVSNSQFTTPINRPKSSEPIIPIPIFQQEKDNDSHNMDLETGNLDLFSKFEFLNKKFESMTKNKEERHENQSIWQEEQHELYGQQQVDIGQFEGIQSAGMLGSENYAENVEIGLDSNGGDIGDSRQKYRQLQFGMFDIIQQQKQEDDNSEYEVDFNQP